MSALKRFGFAMLYVVFTVVGVVMAISSTGSERVAGVGIASFFGLGGLGYWLVRRTRPVARGVPTVIQINHQPRPALVFPLVRSRMVGVLTIALGFLVAGVAFVAVPTEFDRRPPKFVFWFGAAVVVLVLALLPMVLRSVGKGGYLALTPDGIATKGLGRSFVAWDAIYSVGVKTIQRWDNVVLTLRPGATFDAPRLSRAIGRFGRKFVDYDLAYPVMRYDIDAVALVDLIHRLVADPAARARLGTTPL